MISKLEAKGYKYNSNYDYLEGEFNGEEVGISIRTVNNRVWRITVVNRHGVDEANIKVRFNNLFDQFLNNGKYELESGKKLTDSDDIWSGMEVYNLRYDASFSLVDKTINGRVWYTINKKYDKYRLGIFYENIDNAANGEDL